MRLYTYRLINIFTGRKSKGTARLTTDEANIFNNGYACNRSPYRYRRVR